MKKYNTFQVSCGQLVVIFILLRGFPESKEMKIFMDANLRKIVVLGHLTYLFISHPNEQIFTYQVSCGQLVVIFIILRGFRKSKNLKFFIIVDLRTIVSFGHFTLFAYFSSK